MGLKIRTGDLARELGISVSRTIYYTSCGLFKPSGRTPGGLFLFDIDESRKRYEKIQELKRKKVRLRNIIEQLDKK